MERKYSLLKRGGKRRRGELFWAWPCYCPFWDSRRPSAGKRVPEEGCELPIIMYHGLLKEEARQGKYVLSPAQFESD